MYKQEISFCKIICTECNKNNNWVHQSALQHNHYGVKTSKRSICWVFRLSTKWLDVSFNRYTALWLLKHCTVCLQCSPVCSRWDLIVTCLRMPLQSRTQVNPPRCAPGPQSWGIVFKGILNPLSLSVTTQAECFLFLLYSSITGWSKTGCRLQRTWSRSWTVQSPHGHQTCTSAVCGCSYSRLCSDRHPNPRSGSVREKKKSFLNSRIHSTLKSTYRKSTKTF